jgi:hypothetical protein
MKRYLVIGLFAAVALVATTATRAYAHHSFAATYLEDQTVTIEGDIQQFLFRNPHSFVHVMVKEKDGSMVRYAVEWGGAGQLGGQGVTRETLRVGDHVIITGAPGRNPADHRVRMISLFRPKTANEPELKWGNRPDQTFN